MSQKPQPDPSTLKPGTLLYSRLGQASDHEAARKADAKKRLFWTRAIAIGVWLAVALLLWNLVR